MSGEKKSLVEAVLKMQKVLEAAKELKEKETPKPKGGKRGKA